MQCSVTNSHAGTTSPSRRAGLTALPLLLLATFSTLTAQTHPPLKPNARMRAWMLLPDTAVWVGKLVVLADRHLVLAVDSAHPRLRLPLREIERLEISRGHDPLLTIGGPIAGAVLGAVLVPALTEESVKCAADAANDPECQSETPEPLIGAAAGAIVFNILARLVARERWAEVPLGAGLAVTVSPRSIGLKLRLPK
jgi:hypothetical protein